MPSNDLRSLEREWYNKLQEMGFQDIEDTSQKDRPLKDWHSLRFQKQDSESKRESRSEEYYRLASSLFWTYKFRNKNHKEIWRLHASGMSVRDIAVRIKRYKKSMIHYIISKIAKEIK